MIEAHLGTQGWALLYVCKSVAGAQSGPTDGTQRALEGVFLLLDSLEFDASPSVSPRRCRSRHHAKTRS